MEARAQSSRLLQRTWGGVFAAAFFMVTALAGVRDIGAVGWKDPSNCPLPTLGSPIDCIGGTPLNISDSYQTKSGNLTLQGGLTVANSDLVVTGTICWNGDCRTDWGALASGPGTYLPVHTDKCVSSGPGCDSNLFRVESGYASVTGPDGVSLPLELGSFNAVAGQPSVSPSIPTSAVYAFDDPASPVAYAVYGRADGNGSNNAAVYGSAPANSSAWAGYFGGNVYLVAQGDVIVGPSSGANLDGKGELCINNVCLSQWPAATAGDQYWDDTLTYLQPKDQARSVAVGGNTTSAPFTVAPTPSRDKVNVTAVGTGYTRDLLTVQ